MAGSRHVTISDVASRAGLSVATVSRVMHDSPRVSPDARRRVNEAIEALGFSPNALARGLATRTTHTIGVLVPSIADPFWAEVVRGIEDHGHQEHYAVIVASSDQDAERERSALQLFRRQRVDGIIVGASSAGAEPLSDRIDRTTPLVFVNDEHIDAAGADEAASAGPGAQAPSIVHDDCHGAALITAHLLALGHTSIGYIGAAGRASSMRRLQGYRSALEAAGLPCDDALVLMLGDGANEGELGAFRLLARAKRPTALFCYDDMMALGAMKAVRALNLRIPADVAVAGFDDIPIAAYLDPPLTTVRQPMNEMGRQAMAVVLERLRSGAPPRLTTMQGTLVVRGSTG